MVARNGDAIRNDRAKLSNVIPELILIIQNTYNIGDRFSIFGGVKLRQGLEEIEYREMELRGPGVGGRIRYVDPSYRTLLHFNLGIGYRF